MATTRSRAPARSCARLVTSGLIDSLKKQWSDAWGPRMEHLLRYAILALLEQLRADMRDIMAMFLDREFRKQVVAKVTDPQVLQFWTQEYPAMNYKTAFDGVAPIANKVGSFLAHPEVTLPQRAYGTGFERSSVRGYSLSVENFRCENHYRQRYGLANLFMFIFFFDLRRHWMLSKHEYGDTYFMLAVGNIIKFPYHLAALFSGAKSFEANPILGNKFLNAKGLHVFRVATAQRMAALRRRRLAHLIPQEQAEAYRKNGYIKVENFLDEELFAAVLDEVDRTTFRRFDMRQGATVTRRSLIDEQDLTMLPALKRAKNDKRMLNLVRYVASHHGQPLITLQTVLALSGASPANSKDPQTQVHSDTFHSTAKAWLFLTNVGDEDGPFSYVVGSHKMTAERYHWEKKISTSLDTVENKYARRGSLRVPERQLSELGYPKPTRITVKANTLVVADTHGFHARCPSEKPTTRIEIYSSLRRNPFVPWVGVAFGGFHLGALPFVRSRSNRTVIKGLRILKRLGIRGNPWRDIGNGKADEWTGSKQNSKT